MVTTDQVFQGKIPEIYDTYMVPMLFEHFAADMAARVASAAPGAVLETAAGSGVVTRAMDAVLPPYVRLVATDLNPDMLTQAKSRQTGPRGITWTQADAQNLPFDDATFDVVCCQFGVMFLPDKSQGYREALRVLRPGGRLVFNVWTALGSNDFTNTVSEAAAAVFPHDPPQFFARVPHGYHDTADIAHTLQQAGFGAVTLETLTTQCHAPHARHVAVALCQGTPFRNEIIARDPQGLDRMTDAAEVAIKARFGSGQVAGQMQAHVFVAK
jgi:ubiquinone/menaquinone biosynthesis C-methylase UbiE